MLSPRLESCQRHWLAACRNNTRLTVARTAAVTAMTEHHRPGMGQGHRLALWIAPLRSVHSQQRPLQKRDLSALQNRRLGLRGR